MYDLCSGSIEQSRGNLPQNKNLEEILKQELAWTLEQVLYRMARPIVIVNMIFELILFLLYFMLIVDDQVLYFRLERRRKGRKMLLMSWQHSPMRLSVWKTMTNK